MIARQMMSGGFYGNDHLTTAGSKKLNDHMYGERE
jgi:hypothetical protein